MTSRFHDSDPTRSVGIGGRRPPGRILGTRRARAASADGWPSGSGQGVVGGTDVPLAADVELEVVESEVVDVVDGDTVVVAVVAVGSEVDDGEMDGSEVVWVGAGAVAGGAVVVDVGASDDVLGDVGVGAGVVVAGGEVVVVVDGGVLVAETNGSTGMAAPGRMDRMRRRTRSR